MVEARRIYRRWFETGHLTFGLKERSVKGGANTIFAQFFSFGTNMISTAVMARLVSPEGFGIVAMVTAVTGFVVIFKDLGFSTAVVQNKSVSQKQVSTLFWMNILFSLGISLIVVALAPILVAFYHEPRLFDITVVFSLSIFISGFSLQHNALMKRQMRFKHLSKIQMLNSGISLLLGIGLAMMGLDYWAIVGTSVAQTLLNVILLWVLCDWRPNFAFDISRVRHLLRFGAGITGFDLVNYFSRNADNVLIGRFAGAAALGLYSKSYQLLMLPITQLRTPLNTVTLPALSALQHNKRKYAEFYKRYVFILAFFSMPLVACLAVFSKEIVLIVLGDDWIEAGYIFQLLAIASFIQPVAGSKGVVMITMGQTRKYFMWGVVNAVFTVAGYLIGIQWGVSGVAISYIIVNYLVLLPSLYWGFKGTPISVSMFFGEILHPFLFSVISAAVSMLVKYYFADLSQLPLVILGFGIGAMTYIALWFTSALTRSKFKAVMEIRGLIFK